MSHNQYKVYQFPDPSYSDSDGLIASGGDLSIDCLLSAYHQGIFPWYNPGDPILWWSPDPRMVLYPERLHISSSLRKVLKKDPFKITMNEDFVAVIEACAAPRDNQAGTWISTEMQDAYIDLHRHGFAHSFECRDQHNQLVGGLYGIRLGRLFFGESMFSRQSNASKAAMVALCEYAKQEQIYLIDCQVANPHLIRMGAENMPRKEFIHLVRTLSKEY